VADDVVWHSSGRGPRSGDYRGRDAILEYLASIGEDAEQFDSELDDILVGADRTAILFRVSGRRGERLLEIGFVLLIRFEDNQIAEVWSIARDQYALDEFWS
jgi:ketosteroid isomerase-like protein